MCSKPRNRTEQFKIRARFDVTVTQSHPSITSVHPTHRRLPCGLYCCPSLEISSLLLYGKNSPYSVCAVCEAERAFLQQLPSTGPLWQHRTRKSLGKLGISLDTFRTPFGIGSRREAKRGAGH